MNEPFDKRSEFFKSYFANALAYEPYVQSGSAAQQQRWRNFEAHVGLTPAQESLIKTFERSMHVLVLSGVWCGDCMRQGPILAKIAAANSKIQLRFIDNQQNPELRDELRIQGGARVPVVLMLSEDFFEVSRRGDRTLSAYRRKYQNELGPACDSGVTPPSAEELNLELGEWLDAVEHAQYVLRLSPFLRERHKD